PTAPPPPSSLPLHDALPIFAVVIGVVQALRPDLGRPDGRTAVVDEAVALVVEVVAALRARLADAGLPAGARLGDDGLVEGLDRQDRKSTRLNSSHQIISYAV